MICHDTNCYIFAIPLKLWKEVEQPARSISVTTETLYHDIAQTNRHQISINKRAFQLLSPVSLRKFNVCYFLHMHFQG